MTPFPRIRPFKLRRKTKAQVARFVRLWVIVVVPMVLAFHGALTIKAAIGVGSAALEVVWRGFFPAPAE